MMMNEAVSIPADRPRRITRSRVHLKPLTPAQQRLVNFACARSDYPGMLFAASDKIGWLTLRAIVDKGAAEVIDQMKTGKILSIRVRP